MSAKADGFLPSIVLAGVIFASCLASYEIGIARGRTQGIEAVADALVKKGILPANWKDRP